MAIMPPSVPVPKLGRVPSSGMALGSALMCIFRGFYPHGKDFMDLKKIAGAIGVLDMAPIGGGKDVEWDRAPGAIGALRTARNLGWGRGVVLAGVAVVPWGDPRWGTVIGGELGVAVIVGADLFLSPASVSPGAAPVGFFRVLEPGVYAGPNGEDLPLTGLARMDLVSRLDRVLEWVDALLETP